MGVGYSYEVQPSLYALFSRSKYARGLVLDESEDQQGIQQRHLQFERFAVAAIAFSLKHDAEFMSHFLTSVCEHTSTSDSFQIFIEEKRWGDLVLVGEGNSAVYVIECKIKAKLEEHQDPTHKSDRFWCGGYGESILGHYLGPATHLTYIVLGYLPKLNGLPCERAGLKCVQKSWNDLRSGFPQTKLCGDLATTLSGLYVSAFRSGRTDNMKKSNDALMAAETYGLLNDALGDDEVGLSDALVVADIAFDKRESWHFGLAVKTRKAAVGQLKALCDLVMPTNHQIAWLGYTNGMMPDEVIPSVWFYCQRSQYTELKRRLLKAKVPAAQISQGEDDSLVVEGRPLDLAEKGGDKEWFESIFQAVLRA